jgi:hypothetical protein
MVAWPIPEMCASIRLVCPALHCESVEEGGSKPGSPAPKSETEDRGESVTRTESPQLYGARYCQHTAEVGVSAVPHVTLGSEIPPPPRVGLRCGTITDGGSAPPKRTRGRAHKWAWTLDVPVFQEHGRPEGGRRESRSSTENKELR